MNLSLHQDRNHQESNKKGFIDLIVERWYYCVFLFPISQFFLGEKETNFQNKHFYAHELKFILKTINFPSHGFLILWDSSLFTQII